jgi:hypothetical protein
MNGREAAPSPQQTKLTVTWTFLLTTRSDRRYTTTIPLGKSLSGDPTQSFRGLAFEATADFASASRDFETVLKLEAGDAFAARQLRFLPRVWLM